MLGGDSGEFVFVVDVETKAQVVRGKLVKLSRRPGGQEQAREFLY